MRTLLCGFLLCASAFGAIVRTSVTGECHIYEVTFPPYFERQLVQSIASPYCGGLVEPTETFAEGIIGPDRFWVGLNGLFRGGMNEEGRELVVSGFADLAVSMSIELVVTGGTGPGELFGFSYFSHGQGGVPVYITDMERSTNWDLCLSSCGFSVPFVFGEPLELTVEARLRVETNQTTFAGYGFLWGADIQMIRDAEGRFVDGRIMEAGGAGGGGEEDPAVVPEPSVMLMSGLGLFALAWRRVRSRAVSRRLR